MTIQCLLQEKSVLDALEAMRVGRALNDHPLRFFRSVQAHLETPHMLAELAAVQYAIYHHLTQIITEHLTQLREIVGLPAPDTGCADFNPAEDYRHSNAELEAWSTLYHRFVCINYNIALHELARLVAVNERTIRRRQEVGITRLTHVLVERERLFRQQRKHESMLLALPTRHPPRLFGKESVMVTTRHLLTDAESPHHVVLYGPAGIGKSVLAKNLAYDLIMSERFDDFLWLEVGDPAYVLTEISIRLGLSTGEDTLPALDVLRAYLFDHAVLIMLDGAEALIRHEQCADILATLDTASVTLTSQQAPPPDVWCYTIELSELTREQAFDFLDDAARQLPVRLRHVWIDHFETIWTAVGGNPQALKWLLHASCSLPLDAVIPLQEKLAVFIIRLWDQLTPAERRIMLLPMIYTDKSIFYDHVLALSGLDAADVNRAVESLVNRAVFMPHHEAHTIRYTLHSISFPALIEQVRRGLNISAEDTALGFVRSVVTRVTQQLASRTDAAAALQALSILQLAHELGFAPDEQWQWTYQLAYSITAGAPWSAWARQLEQLLNYAVIPAQIAWIQRSLGVALRWLGQLDRACASLDQAHSYYAAEEDPVEYAQVLIEQAAIYRYQLRWDAARDSAQAALVRYQRAGFSDGIARCYHEMAQLALDTRDPLLALSWLDRLSDWVPRTWGMASQAHLALEQYEHALEAAQHAMDNLPLTHPNCGRVANTLGQIYYELGDLNAAIASLLNAALLLDETKDVLGYARACNNLAVAYLDDAERAESGYEDIQRAHDIQAFLERARGIQEHAGDEMGLAVTRQNLAWFSRRFPDSLATRQD